MADKHVKVVVDVEKGKVPGAGSLSGGGGMGTALAAAFGGSIGGGIGALFGQLFNVSKMLDLAKTASPAMANEFDRAVKDATVVIGELFTPVLRMATNTIRSWADAVQDSKQNGVLAFAKEARDTSENIFKPMRDFAGNIFGGITDFSRKFFGFGGSGQPGSSYGASGFNATFGSAQQFAKEQSAAALAATRVTPAEKTAFTVEKILNFLEQYGPTNRMLTNAQNALVGSQHGGG